MYTFSTSDSQFDPGVNNQGFWGRGENQDSNDNYIVGYDDGLPSYRTRNFFTFDLSSLPAGATIESATLLLSRFNSSAGNEATETIEFFDVSTDAATLNNNIGNIFYIWIDLGSGTSYGAFDVPGSGLNADVLSFALDGAALADIAAAAGGFFSIGGTLISADGDDFLFGTSAGAGIHELIVVVPEPATGALLVFGLLGLAHARRARA